jgi:hypothetical protein
MLWLKLTGGASAAPVWVNIDAAVYISRYDPDTTKITFGNDCSIMVQEKMDEILGMIPSDAIGEP